MTNFPELQSVIKEKGVRVNKFWVNNEPFLLNRYSIKQSFSNCSLQRILLSNFSFQSRLTMYRFLFCKPSLSTEL